MDLIQQYCQSSDEEIFDPIPVNQPIPMNPPAARKAAEAAIRSFSKIVTRTCTWTRTFSKIMTRTWTRTFSKIVTRTWTRTRTFKKSWHGHVHGHGNFQKIVTRTWTWTRRDTGVHRTLLQICILNFKNLKKYLTKTCKRGNLIAIQLHHPHFI